ncbi:hypothetical protein PsorP6_009629 [Peronosclerospora sorghi]|uniref:Uncharacterized protein n=1 Tax=Peronosclerospora sorghi TaxID=230839 RepID=A0ACC0VZH8_9STRA|nr:hypothetical protein PsorP6_009629 [Peronosclerospora sorghi]
MSFSPLIAPIKVSALPLSNNSVFDDLAEELEKYARADEIGIPFGVTINFDTVEDRQVTLRERESTAQVWIPIDAIGSEVRKLVNGLATWDEMLERYPNVKVTAELDQRGG